MNPALLSLLLKLPFAASAARVCLHFRPSFFFSSVVLCLGVCLLCTRLTTHFFAVHSVVTVCAVDMCLLF